MVPELNRMLVGSCGSAMCGWKPRAAASSPAARKSVQATSPCLSFTCTQQAHVTPGDVRGSCKRMWSSHKREGAQVKLKDTKKYVWKKGSANSAAFAL